MSVSSPTYFGPAAGVNQVVGADSGLGQLGARVFLAGLNAGKWTGAALTDLVVIGYNALSAGTIGTPVTDAGLAGSVMVGSMAAPLITASGAAGFVLPNIMVGRGIAANLTNAGGNILIGDAVMATQGANPGGASPSPLNGNVIIGVQACQNIQNTVGGVGVVPQSSVVIGFQAAQGAFSPAATWFGLNQVVLIGAQAAANSGSNISAAVRLQNSVGIGYRVLYSIPQAAGNVSNMVCIGDNCFGTINANSAGDCVAIGHNVTVGTTFTTMSVAIGSTISNVGANCVLLGGSINANSIAGSVLIGTGAGGGTGGTFNVSNAFLLETNTGTKQTLMFGDFVAGNLIVGNSTAGTNRDFATSGVTNALKLINGARGLGTPNGGGFFYVNAGALHWVGSSGTDTTIAVA